MSQSRGNTNVLIQHRAMGQTLADSARAAGMSLSTAQRRVGEPAVRTAIFDAQADLAREAAGRVHDLRRLALDRVSEILTNAEDTSIVLRAAELVLRHASTADNTWVVTELDFLSKDIAAVRQVIEKVVHGG
jgi:hypothetical protein